MNRNTSLLLMVSAALQLFIGACNEHLSGNEKKQIRAEIQQMMDDYCSHVKADGLTAEFKYLDSSEDFYWIPPGFNEPLDYNSVAFILTRNAPALAMVDNKYQQLRIVPLSKEIAVYTAQVVSATTDTQGKLSKVKLIESGTVIKRKGGWKLLCGQTTLAQ